MNTYPKLSKPLVPNLLALMPGLFYFAFSIVLIAVALHKTGTKYTFGTNEGWNAYWASAAWTGLDLYPAPSSFRLNNYVPLWFYFTGALGAMVGDIIRAGRFLASLALFLNAVAICCIVREITGRTQDCWFAGVAFLSLFCLFYEDYVAINEPQIAANLFMTASSLIFIRQIGNDSRTSTYPILVSCLLIGGLIKQNVIAVPISIFIFLMFHDRPALVRFVGFSFVGISIACALLYVAFGRNIFASLLFPRRYDIAIALTQTGEQLANYSLFLPLIAISHFAFKSNPKEKFVLIYLFVGFAQGLIFSGGFDVDINVFFDFAIATAILLGLAHNFTIGTIGNVNVDYRRKMHLVAALTIGLLVPPALSYHSWSDGLSREFSVHAPAQDVDLVYLNAMTGHVMCENLALCYWSGKRFEVDVVNLKALILAQPDLETLIVGRINTCSYSLIQLSENWDNDEYDGPFTERIRKALNDHYTMAKETRSGIYRVPFRCSPGLTFYDGH